MIIMTGKTPVLTLFIGAVVVLNVLKFWGAYLIGLNHQVLTAVQAVVPIILVLFIWGNVRKDSSVAIVWIFLFYHTARFFAELLILISADSDVIKFYGLSFSFIRILVIFSAAMILLSTSVVNKSFLFWFYAFFFYTTIFSLLQLPASPVSGVFGNNGGNITSGNGLGFFRANGGLGGTVIMYSNYLLAIFFALFFSDDKHLAAKKTLWIVFLISILLCFSRSLILAVISVLFLYFLFKRPAFLIVFFSLVVYLVFSNLGLIIEYYGLMVGVSDEARLESWALFFKETKFLTALLGQEMGANTGLYFGSDGKMTGDGFLLSWYYDFGIIGMVLLLALLWRSVLETKVDRLSRSCIFLSLLLMMTVNSGLEKIFILEIYFLVFCLLKSQPLTCGKSRMLTVNKFKT